jgi:formylglycine-generating enzyme required for sulfatase activity
MEIHYCSKCRKRVSSFDLDHNRGKIHEDKVYCDACVTELGFRDKPGTKPVHTTDIKKKTDTIQSPHAIMKTGNGMPRESLDHLREMRSHTPTNGSGLNIFILFGALFIVFLIGIIGVFVYKKYQKESISSSAPPATQADEKQTDRITAVPVQGERAALDLPREITFDLGSGVKMEFVLIKPGTFMMGSPKGQARIKSDGPMPGKPQHKVTLTKAFYMGKCEVTQEQYMRVMPKNPSTFKGKNLPVNKVKWEEAQAFCKKLSETSGRSIRLPTEAEWEYSCRAGTTTTWFFGDDVTEMPNYAIVRENSGKKTGPVGQKKPNPWGLHDMFGNVSEWVSGYRRHYTAKPVTDPQGPLKGRSHVFRGSNFNSNKNVPRPGDRASQITGKPAWSFTGFRVVLDVNSPGAAKQAAEE